MYLMKRIATICFMFKVLVGFSQGVYVPLNSDYYHLIDRYEIKSGKFDSQIFTSFKGSLRKDVARLADSTEKQNNLSEADKFNIQYLKNDNWEFYADSLKVGFAQQPFLKRFFERKSAFYAVKTNDFEMVLNPVLDFEQSTYPYKNIGSLNTRGLELRGLIGKKVGFYTFLSENQAFYPDYVNANISKTNTVPNEGFWKPFGTNGYDFFSARGYITFNAIKQINVQFGHDKNFIGNGYRSMFLSDYASPYLFLKLTTKVWRFNYTNLFAEMSAQKTSTNQYFPRKYMAMHHFSLNLTRNFNIGVFEAISFSRSDTATGNSGFELNYLNPIIFYRSVESYLGSRDKAMVGADFKWNFAKHFSAYGQFALNEFVLKNMVAQNGWWANKYAWQIGLKYIDVAGIKNLDLQLEHNFARPYMYQDKLAYLGFSNFGSPIAHPLGANFYEFLSIVRYQPLPRLNLSGKMFYMVSGQDLPNTNYGGDVTKSYLTRYNPLTDEFGNTVGQGNKTTVVMIELGGSYQIIHNLFVDVRQTIRKQSDQTDPSLSSNFTTVGLRWNIAQRLAEF
jgi:hypothetical protein